MSSSTTPTPTTQPRARTVRGQRVVNRLVRGVLRTPLLCRLVGKRLVTVYAVGRTSGRRYTVPVAYARHDGALLIGSSFPWIRNLRTGRPVDIRLRGRRRPADVQVLRTEPEVVAAYAIMTRDNHPFATLNGVRLDPDGTPDPGDLHLAWQTGARAVRLTPR